jgi:hypothetical protein
MKNCYACLSFSALLLFASGGVCAQPLTKTLVKSFKLETARSISFVTHSEVETREWDQPFMRVEMRIELERAHPALLRSLVRNGRYQIRASRTSEGLRLSAPNMARSIMLGDEALAERIQFVVHLPEGVVLHTEPEGEVALSGM